MALNQPDVTGAPYPGAPVTYTEALAAGVPLRRSRWGLADVGIAIVAALLVPVLVLGALIAAGVPKSGGVVLLLSAALPWVGFGLWPWLTTRLQGNGPRIDLGLAFRPVDVLWGLGGGAACLVFGTLAASVTEHFFGEFGSAAGDAAVNSGAPHWVILVFAVFAVVGAPLCEELCFRGLTFAAFARVSVGRGWPGVPVATIASTVLFAGVHFEPVRLLVLLVIGLVLSLLRARTGRVGASVIAHGLNNVWGVIGILQAISG